MGCEVCSNRQEINIEKNQINENTINSKRNLNYLLHNGYPCEIQLNDKKFSSDTNTSSNNGNSTSNKVNTNHNIISEEISYLENMREQMFNEINLIRTNPGIVSEKIDKFIPFITTKQKETFIQVDKNNKIKLNKGNLSFEQCKIFFSKKKPIHPLILKNELTFPFPDNVINDYLDVHFNEFIKESYLTSTLKKLKVELNEKNIDLVNFHYDIMNSNIELSVLLQVIDDTNSMCQRRNNILSKSSKYIGINVGKISNGLYCFYLLFGKDKKK